MHVDQVVEPQRLPVLHEALDDRVIETFPAQFRTLSRLTDLIIPADNGKPGAIQAGVPPWQRPPERPGSPIQM